MRGEHLVNALFISARKLLPLTGGAELASNGLLEYLYSLGFEVTVLSFYEDKDYSEEEKKELFTYVKDLKSVKLNWKKVAFNFSIKYPNNIRKYTRKGMRELVKQELKERKYDVVISDHLQVFEYCKGLTNTRVILHEHNVEYKVWESYSERCRKILKPFVLSNAKRTKKYEAEACLMADGVITVSEEDKNALNMISPQANIDVLIPMSKFKRVKYKQDIEAVSNRLLFVGSYSWYPNRQAARFLVEEVMPLLREKKLGYKLFLVGKCPTETIQEYSKQFDDVVVTGMVDSVEPYFKECDLFINSVTDGGGINIKMLEAMARGIPVVTSEFGLRGIKSNKRDFVCVYSNAQECADIIIELMQDRSKALSMAYKAVEFYKSCIEPSANIKKMLLGS